MTAVVATCIHDEPVQLQLEADWDEFCRLEDEIGEAESTGIRSRWEFGRKLLRYDARPGSKHSPLKAVVAKLTGELGVSEAELYNRRQFAEEYPTEENLSTAVERFRSWTAIRDTFGERGSRVARGAPDPPPLPAGEFSLIYADPPWRYDYVSTQSRAIENQYPTLELDKIKALRVPAADDAVLFLWATSPKLAESLEVVDAWGFLYRTNLVWVKDRIGMGYYARHQHELLLVATKGEPGAPAEKGLPSSVVHAPRGRHSEKPDVFYDLIERLYPGFEYLELFARQTRDGWTSWGDELAAEFAA